MKHKFWLTVLSAFLLWSCDGNQSSKTEKTGTMTSIDIPSSETNFAGNFDSLFEFKRFVVLETTSECLIKNISKVSIYNNEIYILDKIRKEINVFSNDGRYQRRYNHLGQGPGEYISLCDFVVRKDTLYLLDGLGGKLLQYGLNDSLLMSRNMEKAQGIYFFPDTKFALNKGTGYADKDEKKAFYSYAMYDGVDKLCEEAPFNRHLCGYGVALGNETNGFYTYDNQIYTFFPYNDTIYTVDKEKGGLHPYLVIGKDVEKIYLDDGKKCVDQLRKESLIPLICSFYKWKKHLFFAYSYKKENFKYVLAEENGNILYHGPLGLDKNRLPIHPTAYNTDHADGCLLSIVNAFEVSAIAKKRAQESAVLNEISNRISEDDNPVLVFYDTKF